jgi:hypothetical protein
VVAALGRRPTGNSSTGDILLVFFFFSRATSPTVSPTINQPVKAKPVNPKCGTKYHPQVGNVHLVRVSGTTHGAEVVKEVVEKIVILKQLVGKKIHGGVAGGCLHREEDWRAHRRMPAVV